MIARAYLCDSGNVVNNCRVEPDTKFTFNGQMGTAPDVRVGPIGLNRLRGRTGYFGQ